MLLASLVKALLQMSRLAIPNLALAASALHCLCVGVASMLQLMSLLAVAPATAAALLGVASMHR